MFFDKHLSPDQVIGVWESNEPARQAIERLLGKKALSPAGNIWSLSRNTDAQMSPAYPRVTIQQPDQPVDRSIPEHGSSSEPTSPLLLKIDPTWGIQKVFHHYRAALTALCDQPRGKDEIAEFRQANIDLEQRLRAKLPSRMKSLEAIYRKSGLEC